MKKTERRVRNRRGNLLNETRDSLEALQRIFIRMMDKATEQGDLRLLRRILSN